MPKKKTSLKDLQSPTPEQQFKQAWMTCYVVAGMNFLTAVIAAIVQHDDFMSIPEAIAMLVLAIVFVGLGYFGKKKKDGRLFLVGFIILALDLLITLASGFMSPAFIVVRALFMLFLWRGFQSRKK